MNLERAVQLIRDFSGKRLLVVGDLMLDEFIWGRVSRISPEAPVPVVEVVRQSDYPGGAANVARNLREFCRRVEVLGLLGQDAAGAKLRTLLTEGGIGLDCTMEDPGHATIVKTRIIARQQQLVRVDRETHRALLPGLFDEAMRRFEAMLPGLDGVILEDYGKGLFTQELLDHIAGAARTAGKIVTGDPNVQNSLVWRGLTAVKPNRSEAFHFAGMSAREDGDPIGSGFRAARLLRAQWNPELTLVTLGEHGMVLIEGDETASHIPTRAREVFDVSGAGDTAIALFTLALCAGAGPREAAEMANHASGVVVGKLGTATLTPDELLASFQDTE